MVIQSIHELIAAGYSEEQIAAHAGTTQPSINRIKRGKQKPGYEIGVAIVAMRDAHCPISGESEKAAA